MKNKICTLLSVFLSLLIMNASASYKTGNFRLKKTVHIFKRSKSTPNKVNTVKKYAVAELTKNLEYDFAKSSIRGDYNEKLDQLAKYVIDNKYALALRGYADSIGTFKGNWVISEKRAVAVKKYLVQKGVPDNKIVTTPFGSTKPVASNKTRAGRQKNRRVEIKLTDVNN